MDQTPTLALGIRRVLSLRCLCFINIIILRGVILPPLLVTYTRYSGLRWARRVSGVSRTEGFVTLAASPLAVLPRVRLSIHSPAFPFHAVFHMFQVSSYIISH